MADSTFAGIEFTFSYLEPVKGDHESPGEGVCIEDIKIVSVDEDELTRFINAGHTLDRDALVEAAHNSLEAGDAD